MIARSSIDPRIEVAAEALWNAKVAQGIAVTPWRELPVWQRHKQRIAVAAALWAVERYEAERERQDEA